MNKYKRLICGVMALAMALSLFQGRGAAYQTIAESSETNTITTGVTLQNVTRFTDKGWVYIKVLKADLSNPNVKAKVLSSNESLINLETLTTLANNEKSIAAVNGSFFIWSQQQGKGTSIGLGFEDSKLTGSELDWNTAFDKMANLNIFTDGTLDISYLKYQERVVAPNGNSWPVGRINKPYYDTFSDYLVIQDSRYSKTSEGLSNYFKDFVEVVVEADKVKEIRLAQPSTAIPTNGYVISAKGEAGKFLTNNFKLEDDVKRQVDSSVDMSNIQDSISGGTQLIKDGKIVSKYTFGDEGLYPRTAIGILKDKKTMVMVVTEGKQANSPGLNMTELAQYMQEIGCDSALAFDSGGSTTLIARYAGDKELSVVNTPSDGQQRKIANGIGIVNTAASTGKLAGLIISSDDENVFVNGTRKLDIKGFDSNYSAANFNAKDIKWSVSGVSGYVKDNIFYAKSAGEAQITAKIGNIGSKINISVLSSPVRLQLSTKNISTIPGKGTEITVYGYNKNGYGATILPGDLKWKLVGLKGSTSNGIVTFASSGQGYVEVASGNTKAYVLADITQLKSIYQESFEKQDISFRAYPSTVTGSAIITNETFVEGKTSAKLTYDFTQDIQSKRAAYIVLSGSGITLTEGAIQVSMSVKGDAQNTSYLKAEIIDNKGQQQLVNVKKTFNGKWEKAELDLVNIKLPARLTKLYMICENPVPEQGIIYFDNLNVMQTVETAPAGNKYANLKDTTPVDTEMKKTATVSNANSFSMTIFPQLRAPKDKAETDKISSVYKAISKESEIAVVPGNILTDKNGKALLNTKGGVISGNKKGAVTYKNNLIMQLYINDTNSLRRTEASAWSWLLQTLKESKQKNIFIVSNISPFDFSDEREGQLLRDTLTEYAKKGYKIYFISAGKTNESFMNRGVKYITTEGLGDKNTSRLVFNIKNGAVTYYTVTAK